MFIIGDLFLGFPNWLWCPVWIAMATCHFVSVVSVHVEGRAVPVGVIYKNNISCAFDNFLVFFVFFAQRLFHASFVASLSLVVAFPLWL